MAEYIEREALLDSLRESRKALQEICKGLKFPVKKQICDAQILTFQECVLRVKEQPAADVVEVVRCKDCLYSKSYKTINENEGYYCQNPKCTFTYGTNWERIFEPIKNADDYCSYGERWGSNE